MSDTSLRENMLKQNGHAAVEAEVSLLKGVVESEQRRARRLTRWTIIVWAVWLLMLVLMFVMTLLVRTASHAPPGAAAATAPASLPSGQADMSVFLVIGMMLVIGGVVCLPIAGVILLVLTVFAHRSASSSQIRASLASIDAQLKLLAMQQQKQS